MSTPDPKSRQARTAPRMPQPTAVSEVVSFAQHRVAFTLGPQPPMRMPAEEGGIVITHVESRPDGGLASFSGGWKRQLRAGAVPDSTLVLQLRGPATDDDDHVDVWLWIARNRRFFLLGCWKNSGPGWPQLAAPLIHAAHRPSSGTMRRIA
ncbi:hypothetical protein REH65_00160 [Saccharopolyspora sp. ID03-671]|uniref:hypothetical protein n=1 Tax=Saccharopolyspora sp. ID03-671 TaxID=3073066 RepID=UPI0032445952